MKSDPESGHELGRMFSSARLQFEPIALSHNRKLHQALSHPSVYEFIDAGDFKSRVSITKFIERVRRGPKESLGEKWLNYVCYFHHHLIGLLQATVHDGWAEVAFLFSPEFQGKGYASEGVRWLLAFMEETEGIKEFWASTVPENLRSIALLNRVGFEEVQTWDRTINSYDQGDKVFKRVAILKVGQDRARS